MSAAQHQSGATWDLLARVAAGSGDGEEPVILRELLAFSLAGDRYAVPVERVREIVRMRQLTPVPRVPPEILGVISLRGEIVQVMDLRMRLGVQVSDSSRTSRIMVLHGDEGAVTGLLVDTVSEVLRVPEETFRPAAAGEAEFVTDLCEHDGHFVSILSVERVLNVGS